MKRLTLQMLLCLVSLTAAAQELYDFDLTKPQPMYSQETGYGYDLLDAPTAKSLEPFYFSVRVPDGNYKVRVVLGAKKRAAETTVRAENRRLMVHNCATKKGQTATYEFVVNKRSPVINEKAKVRIKDREKDYLTWDEKLTLEFNGDAPAVQSIHIERDNVCPTIYLCGNSTVVDQRFEPWASWGQMFPRWWNENVAISNHAESGLTARTFLASGRLDKILTTLKKGDIVICEFGHNDEKEHKPGDGAWYHYVYQLKIFIDNVRAKEADIIFCTPTQRRSFENDNQHLRNTHGDFPAAMKQVAQREGVPVIDLNQLTKTFFETLGFEGSKRALVHYPLGTFPGQNGKLEDNTHFNPYGAYEVARMVVTAMKQLHLPITQNLRAEFTDFDPSQPDDPDLFKWVPARAYEIAKPDGN